MLARLEVALAIVPELEPHARRPARDLRGVAGGSPAVGDRPAGARRLPPRPDAAHRRWAGRSSTSRASRRSRSPSGSVPTWSGATSPACSGPSTTPRTRVERRLPGRRGGRRQIAFRAAEWADRNQAAFLRGYVDNSGRDPDGALTAEQDLILRAYVADKAVYEAVYEARNRPTWLPIPLGAIARHHASPTGSTPRRAR